MIKLCNVNKIYKGTDCGIKNITISFNDTGLYIINGESGSGKTTLLKVLGLMTDFYGEYIYDGVSINKLNKNELDNIRLNSVGFVFQDFRLFENLTVKENILLDEKNSNETFDNYLNDFKLTNLKNQKVCNLSTGQKQRVAIIRTLLKKPKVLLCDEPTGNLDMKNSLIVMETLKKISNDILVIVVSHDSNLSKTYADYLININNGYLKQDSNIESISKNNFEIKKIKSSLNKFWFISNKIIKNSIFENIAFIIVICFMTIFSTITFHISSINFNNLINETIEINNENLISVKYKGNSTGIGFNEIQNQFDFKRMYFTNYDKINDFDVSSDFFYPCDITSLDNYNLGDLKDDEIVISDYLFEYFNFPQHLKILNQTYYIKGTYKTNYQINPNILNQYFFYFQSHIIYSNNPHKLINEKIEVGNLYSPNITNFESFTDTKKKVFNCIKEINTSKQTLISGKWPDNENEVVISRDYLLSINETKNSVLNKEYSFNVYENYPDYFNSTYFLTYDYETIKIVGVVEDSEIENYEANTYLLPQAYKKVFTSYYDYFECVFCVSASKENINKILNDKNFTLSSIYSDEIYSFMESFKYIRYFTLGLTGLNLIFIIIYLIKDINLLFEDQKDNIYILRSSFTSKKDLNKIMVLKYIIYVSIISVIATIFSIFSISSLNNVVVANYFNYLNIKALKFQFFIPLLIYIFLIALTTIIVLLHSNKKMNKDN